MTQPATVKELKQAFPSASDQFLLHAIEQEMTVKQAGEQLLEELQTENDVLKARIEELEAMKQSHTQETELTV
ncbi:MAG: hypothetical protein NXI28_15235 [bacterium]|nr:hypothetical protein [bacterium]